MAAECTWRTFWCAGAEGRSAHTHCFDLCVLREKNMTCLTPGLSSSRIDHKQDVQVYLCNNCTKYWEIKLKHDISKEASFTIFLVKAPICLLWWRKAGKTSPSGSVEMVIFRWCCRWAITVVPWKPGHLLSPNTQVRLAVVSEYQGWTDLRGSSSNH